MDETLTEPVEREPMAGLHALVESVALALCSIAGIDPDTVRTGGDPVIVRIVGPGPDATPIRVAIERNDAGRLYTRTVQP